LKAPERYRGDTIDKDGKGTGPDGFAENYLFTDTARLRRERWSRARQIEPGTDDAIMDLPKWAVLDNPEP